VYFTYWCVYGNVLSNSFWIERSSGQSFGEKHAFDEKCIFFLENSAVYEIITKHTSDLEGP